MKLIYQSGRLGIFAFFILCLTQALPFSFGGAKPGGTLSTVGKYKPAEAVLNFGLTFTDASVDLNEEFCIETSVSGFDNILGMEFTIEYDPLELEFVSVGDFNLDGLGTGQFGTTTPGRIKVSWFDQNVSGITQPNGTRIFNLCFRARVDNITSSVTISQTETLEILDGNENPVPFIGATGGTVTIGDGSSGNNGGGNTGEDVGLTISNASVQVGDEFCLTVRADNFADILGAQFNIEFNDALLEFVSIGSFGVNGLNSGNFGEPGDGDNPSDVLSFQWFDQDLGGESIPDGSVLFEVCFRAIAGGSSGVIINPGSVEISNTDEEVLGTQIDNGEVTAQGDSPVGDLTFNIGSGTAAVGEEICVPVRVSNFSNILLMQFNITYNQSVLDFESVQALNLDGLSQSSFNVEENNGIIRLSWNDPQVQGISIPNNTVIFELCFSPVSGGQNSPVTISNNGLEIRDGDDDLVDPDINPGNITTTGGGSGGSLTFSIGSTTAEAGKEVCVPFRVSGFNNILLAQFNIEYDESLLDFEEITNFNLDGLSAANFNIETANGIIRVSWNDPEVQGLDVPNGTAIFDMCFTPVSGGSTANLQVSNAGLEVLDGNDTPVSPILNPGTITITGPPSTDFVISLADQSVETNEEFCIPVSVQNFRDIVGLGFELNYDPSMLELVNVGNFNLDGLTGESFGLPGSSQNPPGTITFSWTDPAAIGVTVPNNTVIFELCFRAAGGGGITNVEINDGTIEVIDDNDVLLPSIIENSMVNIVEVCDSNEFSFTFSDENVGPNTNFCVDVAVNDFDDMLGMEFSIQYDPAIISYQNADNFGLEGLNDGSIVLQSPGDIKLSWTDPAALGISEPDGTVIFSLCFQAVGTGSTSVTINRGKIIELIQADGNNEQEITDFCIRAGSVLIGLTPPPTIQTVAVNDINCAGETSGSIDIEVQNGSGNYTYLWSYQNRTTQDLDNLPAGSFTVTVTDTESGLEASQTYSINEPLGISITTPQVTDVSCFGGNDGAITVTGQGGTPPLSYNWGPNGSGPSINNLSAGNYQVTITDDNGCTYTSNAITVGQPNQSIQLNEQVTNAECMSVANGAIALSPSNGAAPYAYSWSDNLPAQSTVSGLLPGDYQVTVTDANSCSVEEMISVGNEGGVMISSMQPTYINSGNDGAINVTITGGSGNLTYVWSGPNGFSAATEDLAQLSDGGQYCLTVTESSGCFHELCVNMATRMRFTNVAINESCPNESAGSISVGVTGGVGPFSYNWSNGQSGSNLNNVNPGNYGLTVTDDQNITLSGTFEVAAIETFDVVANVTPVTGDEGNNNGAIDLDLSGGDPGFTVTWSNGASGTTITGLTTGEYCVTVTDQGACTYTNCFNVTFQEILLSFTDQVTDPLCASDSTGVLELSIVGGTAPYTVNFGNGQLIQSPNGQVRIEDLTGGVLTFVITDNEGAILNGSVNIEEPDPIVMTDMTVIHDTEEIGCTGAISIGIDGGTPGYSVLWNSPNTGFQIINLCEGIYLPTIVDGNGCRQELDSIIVNTFTVTPQQGPTTCPDSQDGRLSVEVTGGETPYIISWLDESGDTLSNDPTITDLRVGTYNLIVTEASGNILSKQVELGSNSALIVEVEVLTDFNGFDVSCGDSADGIMRATADNGQGDDYSYEWLLGDQMIGTGATLNNAAPGMYTIVAIDETSGCGIEMPFELTGPDSLLVTGTITDPSCPGDSDGSIVAVASGGVSSGNYTYLWPGNRVGARLNLLSSGPYTVTVVDDNNCDVQETFILEDPDPIEVNFETVPATDGCNGSIIAILNGGVEPFTFNWGIPGIGNSATANGLCPGEYMVEITDGRACTVQSVAAVMDRRLPCMETRGTITPDGDGLNEAFIINCVEDFLDNRLFIYNRWGQLVYETIDYANDWRGVSNDGEQLPEGAYYFILEYNDFDGNAQQLKGSVTLLRN